MFEKINKEQIKNYNDYELELFVKVHNDLIDAFKDLNERVRKGAVTESKANKRKESKEEKKKYLLNIINQSKEPLDVMKIYRMMTEEERKKIGLRSWKSIYDYIDLLIKGNKIKVIVKANITGKAGHYNPYGDKFTSPKDKEKLYKVILEQNTKLTKRDGEDTFNKKPDRVLLLDKENLEKLKEMMKKEEGATKEIIWNGAKIIYQQYKIKEIK